VRPALEERYMSVETRRLKIATSAAEAALRHAEQARGEVEIIRNLLSERSK
jgi:hypothetical protein